MPNALNADVERERVDEPEDQGPEHDARQQGRGTQRRQALADALDQSDDPVRERSRGQHPANQPLGGERESHDQNRPDERGDHHDARHLCGVGDRDPSNRDVGRQVGGEQRERPSCRRR